MKKILFAGASALLCFLISCSDAETGGTTDNSRNEMNLKNNSEVLKGIETGDTSLINKHIADDAVDHYGPTGDIKGGDSVRWMLADLHNHVKDLKLDIIEQASNGDYIFCLSRITGTTTDASWGMPTGTAMDEKGVDVVKVNKDGKMVEHWGFVDPAVMMKNMGGDKPMDTKMDDKMAPKDTTKK